MSLRQSAPSRRDGLEVRPHEFVGYFFEPDPLLGWRMTPGRQAWFVKPGIRNWIRINSHGFRGPDIQPQKRLGAKRLMVLGDSFGVAIEVGEDEVFSRFLEQSLASTAGEGRQLDIVNASVGGYGTEQQVLYFQEQGAGLAPDIVLLAFHFGDDLIENSANLRAQIHWRLVKLPRPSIRLSREDSRLALDSMPANGSIIRAWQRYWDYLPRDHYAIVEQDIPLARSSEAGRRLRRGLDVLATRWRKLRPRRLYPDLEIFRKSPTPAVMSAWGRTTQLIENLKRQATAAKAELVVAGICTKEQVLPGYLSTLVENVGETPGEFDGSEPNRRLAAAMASLQIPFLDLTPVFRRHADQRSLFYESDLHWNRAGHHLAGETIARFLRDELNWPPAGAGAAG